MRVSHMGGAPAIMVRSWQKRMPDGEKSFVDEAFLGNPNPYYDPPATLRTDTQIKAAIEEEMFWSPCVDSEDVEVHFNAVRATLTGTVASLMEYRAANRNALDGGAVLVRNPLKVR